MIHLDCDEKGARMQAKGLGDWHVLQTKSRQEKALAEDLVRLGHQFFLPLVRQPRYYGQRKFVVELPLFAGYLFFAGSLNDAYHVANTTRRVVQVLRVPDQRQLEWELQNLRIALERDAMLDPYPYLQTGARVEVRAGPMRGLQGVIDSRKENRLVLQVAMLGRAVSLEIEAGLLEVVE